MEGDPEVARVKGEWLFLRGNLAQVAHQLVAKEVNCDAVRIAPRQLATEHSNVEMLSLVEVTDRDGEVENVIGGPHRKLNSSSCSKSRRVSARNPKRKVSSDSTAVGAIFPRLASGPTRRNM